MDNQKMLQIQEALQVLAKRGYNVTIDNECTYRGQTCVYMLRVNDITTMKDFLLDETGLDFALGYNSALSLEIMQACITISTIMKQVYFSEEEFYMMKDNEVELEGAY